MRREGIVGVLLVPVLFFLSIQCNNTENIDREKSVSGAIEISAEQKTDISDEPVHGGELIITSGAGSPKHCNPALLSGYAVGFVGTQVFSSPLRYDENWNPKPYLAERWEVSEDGLSVTLHLVKNAFFHDGKKVTSEDVAFSVLTVKKYHPFKSMFEPVKNIETPDPYTVVIHLTQTHPAILLSMSPPLLPILPKHIYGDGRDIQTHPANLKPIGCGPYVFKEFIPGKHILLERNNNYFIKNRPYLDTIMIHFDSDQNTQIVKMERGEAHLMPGFSDPAKINKISTVKHLAVTHRGYEAIGPLNWLAFNILRKPLDNKQVRQAIAYAIDTRFITEFLYGSLSERAPGPIAPNSPFFEADVQKYTLDLKKANMLLDKAGFPRKSQNIRFSLTCDYIPLIPSQQKELALYLKRQLRKIGIEINTRESDTFLHWAERVSNWDFDMTLDSVFNWGDPVIGVHRTYMSDNIRKGVSWSNTQNYRNSKVDEILYKAGIELDPEKRKKLYSEFQKILTDEVPVFWINVTPFHTVYNIGLKILPTSIWGLLSPFDDIYWKEKPEKPYIHSGIETNNREYSLLEKVGKQAISLIRENGLYDSLKTLYDPGEGFLDIENSGLHVIGFTREGIVFLDNSNQMKSGMDISSILDHDRKKILPQCLSAAENESIINIDGVWPHPLTDKVSRLSIWCGMLGKNDVMCVLYWPYEGKK